MLIDPESLKEIKAAKAALIFSPVFENEVEFTIDQFENNRDRAMVGAAIKFMKDKMKIDQATLNSITIVRAWILQDRDSLVVQV